VSFWVAKNRQKAPEQNAFAERARRKRTRNPNPEPVSEPFSEPETTLEPSEVADAMPDLQALREAAEKAAALVHAEEAKAVPFDRNPESEEYTQAPDIATVPEPEKGKRGRKPSPAVQERNARILEIVKNAEQVGISKPDIAAILEEKEQQVYTSLRQLQAEGKVESKYLDGLGYRWLAL
jgi:hypothetical protein